MMFWRERERDDRQKNGSPLCGQVRVLIVGDSGVGKSSLVHLILKGSAIARPNQTIGCAVGVKHISYGNAGNSSSSIKGDAERDFFVEIWDISGHERYKDCRSLFYTQINGVIFVHDLLQRRTKTGLQKWAVEISTSGTFSAPLSSGGPGGLPVPYIVIGNKADVAAKDSNQGSSGNLVDAARQWVEKQGLLPSSEELPLTESFPGRTGLVAMHQDHTTRVPREFVRTIHTLLLAAKEARYDKEAVIKFFHMLIKRRYFSDDLPAPSPWSLSSVQKNSIHSGDSSSEDDKLHNRLSFSGESYKHNALPPLPAQHNLTPPPTLYPQQPMTVSENYSFQRIPVTGLAETGSIKSKRADINV